MQTELLDNFYKLLESHEPENMQLAFEMAKGMELDWGKEAYIAWWHLHQLQNILYAQEHKFAQEQKLALKPLDEIELMRIIASVHRIKRIRLDAHQINQIPSSHSERLLSLEHIEVRTMGNFSHLSQSKYLKKRVWEFRIIEATLKSFPELIQEFKQIHSLNLSKNEIEEIPNWIGKLQEIRVLNLNFNKIRALPKEMVQLKHLRSLWLAGNQLSSLPNWLAELKELRYLYIFDNPGLSSEEIAALRAVMPATCSIHGR